MGVTFNVIVLCEAKNKHGSPAKTQPFICLSISAPSKCESISPLDDLAFDMYQDPEVAHIIRLLDQKKQDALRQGNNERSKNLKQAIADLQKVPSPSLCCTTSAATLSFDGPVLQSLAPQTPPLAPTVSAKFT